MEGSIISTWDFLSDSPDIFCQSALPNKIVDAKWNKYLDKQLEFVTMGRNLYHFWEMTENLTLRF
jgi:hypothetical protein